MIPIILIIVGLIVLICFMINRQRDGNAKVVFTKNLGKDEIFRIGDEICKTSELMVFLTTAQGQYERVYDEKIWTTQLDGVTLADSVKETVLEKVAQIKTMYLLAKSRGISLDDAEKECAIAAAKDYLEHVSAEQREQLGFSEEMLTSLYEEYALANKVYQDIIRDINPEISDDEARIVTVQHILIRTYERDADGNRVDFMTADKQKAYEKACSIWTEATSGEKSFEELASRYSDDNNITYSFGKGEMEEAFETAAFQLGTDEISPVVEGESGYHIIKCISTFDKDETAENKKKILEQRREEAFGQEYNEFVDTLARKLNQSAWDEVALLPGGQMPDADFFATYSRFFGQAQ